MFRQQLDGPKPAVIDSDIPPPPPVSQEPSPVRAVDHGEGSHVSRPIVVDSDDEESSDGFLTPIIHVPKG
jgi:hypothetical protein